MFRVMSVYFNIRNTLPKSGTFLLGHPVCIYIYIYIFTPVYTVPEIKSHTYMLIEEDENSEDLKIDGS